MTTWRLSHKARADLRGVWSFTADHWSVDQADRYIDQIFAACRSIAAMPGLGSDAGTIRAGYRKISAGSHVLNFRRERGAVLIVRVLHQRMDARKHL